jgi:hypothetical protein
MEMVCLLKTSRDLQMLFAAVTHLVEGLSLEALLALKMEKFSGYTETNSIHNRTTVEIVLENANKK